MYVRQKSGMDRNYSLSNMNTKPRGWVVCTATHMWVLCTYSQSNMNTKPREGVLCTDKLTEQHEHQT